VRTTEIYTTTRVVLGLYHRLPEVFFTASLAVEMCCHHGFASACTTTVCASVRMINVLSDFRADYKTSLRDVDPAEREAVLEACHQRSADKLLDLCFKNGGIYTKLGQHVGQLVRSRTLLHDLACRPAHVLGWLLHHSACVYGQAHIMHPGTRWLCKDAAGLGPCHIYPCVPDQGPPDQGPGALLACAPGPARQTASRPCTQLTSSSRQQQARPALA
jgi:hypothetical protein